MLLVVGHLNAIQDVFLVAESRYYATSRLKSLYGFLEYAILDRKPKKTSSCLSVFLTSLNNVKV